MKKMLLLLFCVEALISFTICGLNPYDNYTLLSCILVVLNSIVILLAVPSMIKEDRFAAACIIISYFIRMLFVFLDLYGRNIFVLPNSGSDSEKFQINAVMYALYGMKANYEGREIAFTEIVFGLFYRVFGVQRILLQHFNVLLSIGTIVNVYYIMKYLKIADKFFKVGMFLICFLPNYIILSAIFSRESIIIFLITLSLLYFAKWIVLEKEINIFIAIICSMVGSMFHAGAIIPAICYLIYLLLYNNKMKKLAITRKTLFVFIIGIICSSIVFIKFYDVFFLKLGEIDSIQDITKRVSYGLGGGSDYIVPGANVDNIKDFLLASPVRMFYFAASPVPWMWRGGQDVIAFLFDALPYVMGLILGLCSLFEKDRDKRYYFISLVIIIILATFMFGWGVNSAGTALRHRNKYIAVEVLLIVMALDTLKGFKRKIHI